jgi:cellulose synthase/poly-beta-1,6-N-acetylglucosamine synthase-like glycosyltransferase
MIIISILFFIYLITIAIFSNSFDKVKPFSLSEVTPKTKFTIVIPFRNEANHLPTLLKSISKLNYPTKLVDFIFVDDDSSDNSGLIINRFASTSEHHLRIVPNELKSNSPKKDAITLAVNLTNKEWIVTTDADCILPSNWLKSLDQFIQKNNPNMVVAPVTYTVKNNFLHQFQLLDFLSLQASTISGFGFQKPFLCNGANLAYKKEIFKNVNGFDNNDSITSGDDVFLLEKFIQYQKDKVHYLKSEDAIVTTNAENSVDKLINQRVRWASKTANNELILGKIIGVIILLGNSIIAFSPVFYYLELLSLTSFGSYIFMKLFFDCLLIERISSFYKQKVSVFNYALSSVIYPYYTILIVILSTFGKFNWKGRRYKK